MIFSFVAFLILFVLIGIASSRHSQPTTEDYLLAGKNIKPWLAGLSLFSTNNSGFMFIGYIGITYMIGLSAIWILIGWYTGELLILWRTARILRQHNETVNAHTYSALLANWTGKEYKAVRILCALITIVFLSGYAAAQFSAGGKALNALLGWDMKLSATIGFLIVTTYCLAGGIRATIWTDAAQTIVMFISLLLVTGFGLYTLSGPDLLHMQLNDIDTNLSNIFAGSYRFGIIGFIAGWLFGGMGVLGQPHTMIRFMVIDKAKNVKTALLYYAGLTTSLTILCTIAALCARAILPELIDNDPELALPMLASWIMPDILGGIFLAGLFAAAISTADSQVLSSAAALTQDLFPNKKATRFWTKIGTVLIAATALSVVLLGFNNVFKLVTFSWSVMGAGFGPLLFIYSLGKTPSQMHAITMMLGGIAASLTWEFAGLSGDIYNVMPGLLTGLAIYFIPAFACKVMCKRK